MGLRSALNQQGWRQRGFDLSVEDIDEVDRFFEAWFPIYNLPGVEPYRSQEALFSSYSGSTLFLGEEAGRREQKNWVSASRAGYCVALTERKLRMRGEPDYNLRQLLKLMEDDDPRVPSTAFEAAMWRGARLTAVTEDLALERPETARQLRGFRLREAVFADIKATLFVKLQITGFPVQMNKELGDVALRWGHVLAVCEEALPSSEAVFKSEWMR